MTGSAAGGRNRLARGATSVGLAVLGATLLWSALAWPSAPDPVVSPAAAPPSLQSALASPSPSVPQSVTQAAARRTPAPPAEPDVRDRVAGVVLPESHPVTLAIPRIGVRSRLVDLGLDRDGAMEVPRDPDRAGWFSRGATPGALGPAVIAGHVTWNGANGVFHRLGTLRRGDRVSVSREDGKTAVFRVTRVSQYAKSHFPSRSVYGAIDHAGLRLITCGGSYDAAAHRYLDNVVVFATLDRVIPSRR